MWYVIDFSIIAPVRSIIGYRREVKIRQKVDLSVFSAEFAVKILLKGVTADKKVLRF